MSPMPSRRTSKEAPAKSARHLRLRSVVAPSSTCGRTRRPRGKPYLGRRHHRPCRILDQRRYRDLCPPTRATRRAGSGRSGGRVLAGVRRCGQGADPGALAALPPGRPAGHRHTADLRGPPAPGIRSSGHSRRRSRGAAGHRALYHAVTFGRLVGSSCGGSPASRLAPSSPTRSLPHSAERLDRAARGAGREGGPDRERPIQRRGAERQDDRSHRPRCGHGRRLDRHDVRAGSAVARAAALRGAFDPTSDQFGTRAYRAAESPAATCSRTLDRRTDVCGHGQRGRRRAAAGSSDGREDVGVQTDKTRMHGLPPGLEVPPDAPSTCRSGSRGPARQCPGSGRRRSATPAQEDRSASPNPMPVSVCLHPEPVVVEHRRTAGGNVAAAVAACLR